MRYLDANFFIFALLDNTERGEKARKIYREIIDGTYQALTSSLALDEVMWVLIKNRRSHLLRIAVEGIYSTPNLEVVEVSSLIPLTALDIIEEYGLNPRDAFHVAIMKENKIKEIISDDGDFDKIDWISRVTF